MRLASTPRWGRPPELAGRELLTVEVQRGEDARLDSDGDSGVHMWRVSCIESRR